MVSFPLCFMFLPRNRTDKFYVCVCVCVCVIYFKELVQAVMKEVSPKSTRWIGKLEPQEELILQFKSKSHLLAEFLITWGSSVFSSMHAFN